MKTTILGPYDESRPVRSLYHWAFSLLHLILCGIYGTLILMLSIVPIRHGFGGGSSNAAPPFLLIFTILALTHLALVFSFRYRAVILLSGGVVFIVASTITIGLLLLSRPSFNLIHSTLSDPLFVYGPLVCSLFTGLYLVLQSDMTQHLRSKRKSSVFPLSPDRYGNVRVIASGGVGTIWYAERKMDGTPVILKVPIQDDEKTGMSFLQELSLWKELDHPNIVRIFAVNILPVPYIEMEYVTRSLADLKKPVSIETALRIISGIGSALAYAHSRGIIHCDLKPTNILMDSDEIPKLTDWGLSRSASSRWTVPGFSPRYAAPEQRLLHGECSMATDIWQTGLIFVELLTGEAEIPSGNEIVFNEPGGKEIFRIIHRSLNRDPRDRYPDGAALMKDISGCF